MTEIDFLPQEYLVRQSSRRDRRWLLAIAGVVVLGIAGSALAIAGRVRALAAELAGVEREHEAAVRQLAELKQLTTERDTLRFDANLRSLIRARPALSRVLAELAASCPDQLTLTEIDVRTERTRAVEPIRKPADTSSSAEPKEPDRPTALREFKLLREEQQHVLRVQGYAKSERQIYMFMRELQACDCFSDVTFEIDSQTQQSQLVSRFQIRCIVAKVL
jgi:Tfp pilus assembly protein PilN